MHLFGKDDLPVKHAIARNFSVFNNYHSSVPSFSTPNPKMSSRSSSSALDSSQSNDENENEREGEREGERKKE